MNYVSLRGESLYVLLTQNPLSCLLYPVPIPVYLMHPTIHNLFTSPHIPLIDVQDIKNHQHQMNFAMETYQAEITTPLLSITTMVSLSHLDLMNEIINYCYQHKAHG